MINGSPYWNVEQYIVFSIYTKKTSGKKKIGRNKNETVLSFLWKKDKITQNKYNKKKREKKRID
jgi:hypothetical protein